MYASFIIQHQAHPRQIYLVLQCLVVVNLVIRPWSHWQPCEELKDMFIMEQEHARTHACTHAHTVVHIYNH